MAEKIERKFTGTDDAMLERAEVFHDQLTLELADFTARFPWLDAAWLTAFQNDIDAADAFPKDDSVTLDIKVLTGDVTAAMQQGYAGLQTLGGYAKLAWPTDMARQRVFGQQNWKKAYSSTLKLQEALELAHTKAENASYKADLLAKGYTQAEIDMLETLSDEIKLKNRLQEAAKAGRKVSVHDRVSLLNVVWAHMLTINTCASVVWAADAERKGVYNMYPSSGGGSGTSTKVTISGRVTDADTTLPLQNAELMLYPTISGPTGDDPTMLTDANGEYDFAIEDLEDAISVNVLVTLAGYLEQTITLELEPGTEYNDIDFALTASS